MKADRKNYDVIIIGGGPAGMSAAVWCADLGLKPVLIEQNSTLGGQLLWTHNPITNYLGAEAANGVDLAAKFAEQVGRAEIRVVTGREVASVDLSAKTILVDDLVWTADAIVIATGVRRRKLGIPGEEEFEGCGILVSGARDREAVREKTVVIVGGGDAALENALMLSEFAQRVVVIHRREALTARREFLDRVRERGNVEFILDSVVTSIDGDERVESVTLQSGAGERMTISCEAVLMRIGVVPNSELFAGQVDLDDRGYVVVDKELQSSIEGVWAIGDITGPLAMTIANAVGSGAVAAKSIADSR